MPGFFFSIACGRPSANGDQAREEGQNNPRRAGDQSRSRTQDSPPDEHADCDPAESGHHHENGERRDVVRGTRSRERNHAEGKNDGFRIEQRRNEHPIEVNPSGRPLRYALPGPQLERRGEQIEGNENPQRGRDGGIGSDCSRNCFVL